MATATLFRGFCFGPGMLQRAGDLWCAGFSVRTLFRLLPVLPILLLNILPSSEPILLLNILPSSEPVYSLSRSYPYEYKVATEKGVSYYVKSAKFEQDNPPGSGKRGAFEHKVEREYITILTQNCRLEMHRRQWGFIRETPHCDMLQRFEAMA